MRTRILASILCMCIMLFAFAGCGMKLNSSDPSPSGEAPATGSGATDSGQTAPPADTTMYTGIVSDIIGRSISLDLVSPYSASAGDAAAPDEAAAGSASYVTVGSAVFAITGESMTVTVAEDAVIILESQEYTTGSLMDIVIGDVVAIAFDGSTALSLIDKGPGAISDNGDIPGTDDSNTGGIPDSDESVTYIVDTENLNVRSGPNSSASILGKLAKGTKVTGTVTGGWLKFTYNDQTAYCSADYLTVSTSTGGETEPSTGTPSGGETSSGSETSSGVPDSSTAGFYAVNTESLNIRDKPTTSGLLVGKVSQGALITGTVKNGWLEFKYNNETAYCSADYLISAAKSAGTGTGGVPDSSSTATYIVVTDSLNVRSGPSTTTASILGTVPKGTSLTGTVSSGWLKFSYNGRIAYVKATYISESN